MTTTQNIKKLPRNVWVVTATSLLTDISSEMIVYLIPLFLANVLKAGTAVIARVPFDEGSLTGTLRLDSKWPQGDWRNLYFTPDRLRETRRSDVAFWLHLLAAPLLVRAAFATLGVSATDTPRLAPTPETATPRA